MKKYIYLFMMMMSFSLVSNAQMLNVNYQMSVPFGKTKDFISDMSFRGANIEYHKFLFDQFTVGFSLGWNVYYNEDNKRTQDFVLGDFNEEFTITGNQYRYINTVPMMAHMRYFFTPSTSFLRPYAGAGIGTCWSEYRLDVGQYTSNESRWQFQIAPEVGTLIPLNDQVAANVGVRYNYATKAANGRVPEISALTISLGIVFMGAY